MPASFQKNKDSKFTRKNLSPKRVSKNETLEKKQTTAIPSVSVLLNEEKYFPRGGASSLTPLETRQVQIEAKRDVLFPLSNANPHNYAKSKKQNPLNKDKSNDPSKEATPSKTKKQRFRRIDLKEEPKLTFDHRSASQLSINEVVRGMVEKCAEKGLFVKLGPSLRAFVTVTNLSDAFIKDWRSIYAVDQMVTGRITHIDAEQNQIQLTLKPSIVDPNYVPPVAFEGFELRQVVNAKVVKVESYGVFIRIENSAVSGLCHKSQIADSKITDLEKLYQEGDTVKAIVLKINKDKHRINFGLKSSYFASHQSPDSKSPELQDSLNTQAQEPYHSPQSQESNDGSIDGDNDVEMDEATDAVFTDKVNGLSTGGFDWTGHLLNESDQHPLQDRSATAATNKKRKRNPEIQFDRTGELDKFGPQELADFERILLGRPNDSTVWIQYMAFQLGLGELDKVRAIAERALRTINLRDQDEKLNIWVALLNLENTYGTDESIEEVLARACEYQDKNEIHERLVTIFIESGQNERANALLQRMTKLKSLSANPSFWLNYATFLMTTRSDPDVARSLLLRATQSVPVSDHRLLAAKFGALEFASPHGDKERGRTVFEGLLSAYPKRYELWDMYVDLERGHQARSAAGDSKEDTVEDDKNLVERVRKLYERMVEMKMKKRRAVFVFKRWLEFEEKYGSDRDTERVKALATDYAKTLGKKDNDED